MNRVQAIALIESLLDRTAEGSVDTVEGMLGQEERDALVFLLDEARVKEEEINGKR